ncbi:MAG TPA: cytochrome c, partial [Bryobacteraceae bacterium]|nr:cytochrome c [Bryobacteraceae bacterium]
MYISTSTASLDKSAEESGDRLSRVSRLPGVPKAVGSLLWGLLLISGPVAMAQPPDARILEGQRLFETSCTACHGQNAKGGRGPDLTGKLNRGSLESEMIDNIVGG